MRLAKRCMDLLIGAGAILVLSPVLALIAIIVRLDSPGPVLFRQTRIGMGRRPFEMWKFRTMVRDASEEPHREFVLALLQGDVAPKVEGAAPSAPCRPIGAARRNPGGDSAPPSTFGATSLYKLADDPRVTRVGRWLRKTSLDELPQLFNVVRGEMSLVGPRPPATYEYEAYQAWQLERFEMPQGMTGLWQVSGRNRLSYRRMHELDIEYVRSWSLWLDLKILARTLRAVFFGREMTA